MEKQAKVPKLRFPGFTGEWEERKLVDKIDRILDYRGKSPTKFGMEWGNSGYLVLSALNVKDGYIDKSIESKYGNQELFDRWMGDDFLKKDEVLFTTEAPLGNVAQIPDNDKYILNQRVVGFKTLPEEMDNNFLATLLRSPLVQRRLISNSTGGTAKGIGMKEFAKFDVKIPFNVLEQKKIGRLFRRIDNLITLHQRKLTHLHKKKKSLLQKIFPKKGERFPELRFPGFTGGWKLRRLGDIAKVSDSARVPNSLWTEEGVPYLRSSDLSNNGLCGDLYISYDSYNMYARKTGAPHKGDVLFTSGGQVGIAFLKNDENPVYVQGGAVLYVKTSISDVLDGSYLKTYFESPAMIDYLASASVGGTIQHFTLKPANLLPIPVPILSEQQKIGAFFGAFDDLIALHQRKLSHLKKQKQALLQQMFV